jgi:DNA-binding LacI/PurR family transcriptional regulator
MPFMPAMSYAEQPAYALGQTAIDLLLERFEQPKDHQRKIVLESSLHLDVSSTPYTRSTFQAVSQGP